MNSFHELPADATHSADSPIFDETTAPEAILDRHETAHGNWAILRVHSGELTFVDIQRDWRITIVEDQEFVIAPEVPHKVELSAPVTFQLAFYKDKDARYPVSDIS